MVVTYADPDDISDADRTKGHFGWESHQIVVATGHIGAVGDALQQLGIKWKRLEESQRLGLTLITLLGENDQPGDAHPAAMKQILAKSTLSEHADAKDPIAVVLNGIRRHFGPSGNWSPSVGKNRTVGHVDSTGGRIAISFGKPVPLTNGHTTPAPPPAPAWHSDGPTIRIGIVDTVLRQHDWFRGASLGPVAEPVSAEYQSIRAGHATALAGIILQEAPTAHVEVFHVLNDDGAALLWDVAKGIATYAGSGIDILNLSLACYTDDGQVPMCLAAAIACLDRSTVVVAGAGNLWSDDAKIGEVPLAKAPAWPAAIPSVIAVGSVDDNDVKSSFSPTGLWVDTTALGERVLAPLIGGLVNGHDRTDEWAYWTGTSFSAAKFTGALAAEAIAKGVKPRALRPW